MQPPPGCRPERERRIFRGNRLLLVGPELEALVVLDLDLQAPPRMVPLPGSAYWVWADPAGPFVYAGWVKRPDVTLMNGEPLQVAAQVRMTDDPGR